MSPCTAARVNQLAACPESCSTPSPLRYINARFLWAVDVAALGGFLKPFGGLGVVLKHALAEVVAESEGELGLGVAGFGLGLEFGDVCRPAGRLPRV